MSSTAFYASTSGPYAIFHVAQTNVGICIDLAVLLKELGYTSMWVA